MATQHGRWIDVSTSQTNVSLSFLFILAFPKHVHSHSAVCILQECQSGRLFCFVAVCFLRRSANLAGSIFSIAVCSHAGVPTWPAAAVVCNLQECQSGRQSLFYKLPSVFIAGVPIWPATTTLFRIGRPVLQSYDVPLCVAMFLD